MAAACATTGLVGNESGLFRFTVRRSLLFAMIAGPMTFVQACVLPGMAP
ncbi:L-lactate permease [Burkholderia territorii]|nr:L-lactate permease [Burkholderia territorii]